MFDEMIKRNAFPMVSKNLFDDFFDSFFNNNAWSSEKKSSSYPMNIMRRKHNGETVAVYIEYALAGFSKEEIHVSVKDGVLLVSAKHDEGILQEGFEEEPIVKGISYRSFSTAYQLMDSADRKAITSSFKDGLLTITIPIKSVAESNEIVIE